MGIIVTLAFISGLGLYSGRRVRSASDFETSGSNAGAVLVAGTIMGTLVGGTSTIGTAQLAFNYGLSAWWFTLGGGIGCLILAVAYAIPLRHSGKATLMQIISDEYGPRTGLLASVLCTFGIFINLLAQMLSGMALLTTITPLSELAAVLCVAVLMAFYVIFGGVWGTGMVGVFKLLLIYISVVVSAVMVLLMSGGLPQMMGTLYEVLLNTGLNTLNGFSVADVDAAYVNLLARGVSKDLGSGISLILGVISTQTYAQAIWSAKSDSAARKGALISGFLIPPIGLCGILVGMFMRNHYITAAEAEALTKAGQALPDMLILASDKQAFPVFIVNYMPSLFGGVVLATLLIAVVGTGAGLALGSSSIWVNDIFKKLSNNIRNSLFVTRATIIVILAAAAMLAYVVPASVINDFSFLSMGLRGAVVFVPLTAALFLKGRLDARFAMAAVVLGPVGVVAAEFIFSANGIGIDPLFIGMGVSLILAAAGIALKKTTAR